MNSTVGFGKILLGGLEFWNQNGLTDMDTDKELATIWNILPINRNRKGLTKAETDEGTACRNFFELDDFGLYHWLHGSDGLC